MKKIYIIDDDRDIVESIKIVLESEEYEVAAQYDEVNSIENISNFGPDLIILDVMFPENESAGFDIARDIKSCDAIKDIPIIMLSAINEKGIYAGTFSNQDKDDSFLPVSEFVEKLLQRPECLAHPILLVVGPK